MPEVELKDIPPIGGTGPRRRWHVCSHLLESLEAEPEYCRRYTGRGMEYDLVCMTCTEDPDGIEATLRPVPPSRFDQLEHAGYWERTLGQAEVRERASGLRFVHDEIRLPSLADVPLLDLQPVEGTRANRWIGLTAAGRFLSIDLDRPACVTLAQLCRSDLDLQQPVSLHLSPRGEMAAVVNTRGQHGVVVELRSGRQTMRLEREVYHIQHCTYPSAFFEVDGRLMLAHGTAWNRLDISDPITGRCLTGRSPTSYRRGEPRPPHYLDYFHGRLTVSPDGCWIADDGWVWQPAGIVRTWDLQRWARENVWESEDGPSVTNLAWRAYFWNGPLCWVGGSRIAIWGFGDGDLNLLPAASVFDVPARPAIDAFYWFPGPQGRFVFDDYLFSFSPEHGMSGWDVDTGERLLHVPEFVPDGYHRGARRFVARQSEGVVQVSSLRGEG